MTDEQFGRVAEVWSDTDGSNYGTGYLIGPDLILTALHVVHRGGHPPASEIVARPLLIAELVDGLQEAELIWPLADQLDTSPLDAALLRLKHYRCKVAPKIDLGKPDRPPDGCNVSITAIGFPAFAPKAGERHDTLQINGIAPLASSLVAGKYRISELQNAQRLPADHEPDWRGMSGAPLLSGDRLIGLLVTRSSKNDRYDFSGIRIEKLLQDPIFRSHVTPCMEDALDGSPEPADFFTVTPADPLASDLPTDDPWEVPDAAFEDLLNRPLGGPAQPAPAILAPVLAKYWDRLDSKLQDAFALAATLASLAGKAYISTTTLFAALRRLQIAPLPNLVDALPEGAMRPPAPDEIVPDYAQLAVIPELSSCVTRSLESLSPKVGRDAVLSSEDMFVDIAKYGTGNSTRRLRAHGVSQDWIESKVDLLDWRLVTRDASAG